MDFIGFSNWCGGPGFWSEGAGGGWGGMMPFHFGGIFQLLLIGLIIYFTIRLFRRPTRATGPDTAEETLRERFANGEIDAQTYQSMQKELKR